MLVLQVGQSSLTSQENTLALLYCSLSSQLRKHVGFTIFNFSLAKRQTSQSSKANEVVVVSIIALPSATFHLSPAASPDA